MMSSVLGDRNRRTRLLIAMLITFAIGKTTAASAGVIAYVYQSGADVTATYTGSFSTLQNGFVFIDWDYTGLIRGGLRTNGSNAIAVGSNSAPTKFYSFLLTSGSNLGWGTGNNINNAVASDSNTFSGLGSNSGLGLYTNANNATQADVLLGSQYINGTPISATSIWSNKTMAELGLDRTGTYVYTNVGGTETFTVVIGSAPPSSGAAVPEPSSLAVASILGAVGWHRTRRKRKQPNG